MTAPGDRRSVGSGKRTEVKAVMQDGARDTQKVPRERSTVKYSTLQSMRFSGAERHVGLLVPPDSLDDGVHRLETLLPTDDLHALSFQILIALKEMLDLLQHVLGRVGDVEPFLVIRIVQRHGENLVVGLAAVE